MLNINYIDKNDINKIEMIGELCLPIYYSSSDLFFLLFDKKYILYKAEYDDEIVGFCIIKKYNNRNHIMSIAVLENYRNKKIGTEFINKAKNNYNQVSLYVQVNNLSAIKFYEKNGFEKVKVLKNYYNNLKEKDAYYFVYSKI